MKIEKILYYKDVIFIGIIIYLIGFFMYGSMIEKIDNDDEYRLTLPKQQQLYLSKQDSISDSDLVKSQKISFFVHLNKE